MSAEKLDRLPALELTVQHHRSDDVGYERVAASGPVLVFPEVRPLPLRFLEQRGEEIDEEADDREPGIDPMGHGLEHIEILIRSPARSGHLHHGVVQRRFGQVGFDPIADAIGLVHASTEEIGIPDEQHRPPSGSGIRIRLSVAEAMLIDLDGDPGEVPSVAAPPGKGRGGANRNHPSRTELIASLCRACCALPDEM